MAKVLSDSSVIVVSEMRLPNWCINDLPADQERRLVEGAKEFEKLVRQHVRPHMDLDFFCNTNVERNYKCSHCGFGWTEKSDTFNGGCCDEDMKNEPQPVAAENT